MTFKCFVNKDTLLGSVTEDREAIIEVFRKRIVGWYFDPISHWPKDGHEAYAAIGSLGLAYAEMSEMFPAFLPSVVEWSVQDGEVIASLLEGRKEAPVSMSGTGTLVTHVGDSRVVDPWVLRDKMLQVVHRYFDTLGSHPDRFGWFSRYVESTFRRLTFIEALSRCDE